LSLEPQAQVRSGDAGATQGDVTVAVARESVDKLRGAVPSLVVSLGTTRTVARGSATLRGDRRWRHCRQRVDVVDAGGAPTASDICERRSAGSVCSPGRLDQWGSGAMMSADLRFGRSQLSQLSSWRCV